MSGRLDSGQLQRLDLHEIADALRCQPELFSAAPVLRDSGLISTAKRGRFSGDRMLSDESRCLLIAAMVEAGASDRQIAEAVHCARESIPPVIEALEARGLIRPLKTRVERRIGRVTEAAAARLEQLMDVARERGLTKDEALELRGDSILVGIGADKLGISGAPQVHLHAHEHRVAPVGEDLARHYAEQLRTLSADVESGDQSLISNGFRSADTSEDTAGAVVEVSAVVGSGSSGSAVSAAGAGADTPGGGSASGAGVGEDDGN